MLSCCLLKYIFQIGSEWVKLLVSEAKTLLHRPPRKSPLPYDRSLIIWLVFFLFSKPNYVSCPLFALFQVVFSYTYIQIPAMSVKCYQLQKFINNISSWKKGIFRDFQDFRVWYTGQVNIYCRWPTFFIVVSFWSHPLLSRQLSPMQRRSITSRKKED